MSDPDEPGFFSFIWQAILSLLLAPFIPVVMFFVFLVGGIVIMGVISLIATVVANVIPSGKDHNGHPHYEERDHPTKKPTPDNDDERKRKEPIKESKSHPHAK